MGDGITFEPVKKYYIVGKDKERQEVSKEEFELSKTTIDVHIVKDQPCPYCGAYWGNPNKELDFPNRIKVTDEKGNWCKCYNPNCPVSYYSPDIKEVELTSGQFPYPYMYVRR